MIARLVPYSREALLGLLERYNEAIWPAQLVALLAVLLLLLAVLRRWPAADRIAAGVLAAAWLWCGAVWQAQHYATLNWAGFAFAGLFGLQAVLLLWTGVLRGRLRLDFRGDDAGWTALALMLAAFAVHPLAAWLAGAGGTALQVAGTAPTPTVILTLGVLLLAVPRVPVHLLVLPVLWSLIDGAAAWTLGLWADLLLPLAGLAAVAVAVQRRREIVPGTDFD